MKVIYRGRGKLEPRSLFDFFFFFIKEKFVRIFVCIGYFKFLGEADNFNCELLVTHSIEANKINCELMVPRS